MQKQTKNGCRAAEILRRKSGFKQTRTTSAFDPKTTLQVQSGEMMDSTFSMYMIHPKLYFKLPIRIENFMNFPLPCSVQFVLKRGSVETGWLQSNENFYLGFSWLVAKYNSSEY